MNTLVTMPGVSSVSYEILFIIPSSFKETTQVIQALKERKAVILNLAVLEEGWAQRVADFLSGAIFAMSGHKTQVGKDIFLFTPESIQIKESSVDTKSQPQPIETSIAV